MQLLPPRPHGGDEVCFLQNGKMLADCLPRHVETRAKFAERLPILGAQSVEQSTATRISKRPEDFIHVYNMQPFGCISRVLGYAADLVI